MPSSFRFRVLLPIAASILGGGFCIYSPSAVAADIVVNLNKDLLVKLPPRVATIVVGNPLFIDAHMAAKDTMVLTAKSYGETNIILLDRAGAVLMQTIVSVRRRSDDGDQIIYRGVKRVD